MNKKSSLKAVNPQTNYENKTFFYDKFPNQPNDDLESIGNQYYLQHATYTNSNTPASRINKYQDRSATDILGAKSTAYDALNANSYNRPIKSAPPIQQKSLLNAKIGKMEKIFNSLKFGSLRKENDFSTQNTLIENTNNTPTLQPNYKEQKINDLPGSNKVNNEMLGSGLTNSSSLKFIKRKSSRIKTLIDFFDKTTYPDNVEKNGRESPHVSRSDSLQAYDKKDKKSHVSIIIENFDVNSQPTQNINEKENESSHTFTQSNNNEYVPIKSDNKNKKTGESKDNHNILSENKHTCGNISSPRELETKAPNTPPKVNKESDYKTLNHTNTIVFDKETSKIVKELDKEPKTGKSDLQDKQKVPDVKLVKKKPLPPIRKNPITTGPKKEHVDENIPQTSKLHRSTSHQSKKSEYSISISSPISPYCSDIETNDYHETRKEKEKVEELQRIITRLQTNKSLLESKLAVQKAKLNLYLINMSRRYSDLQKEHEKLQADYSLMRRVYISQISDYIGLIDSKDDIIFELEMKLEEYNIK
ncbi:hypothetical protein BB558_001830 [Smittium angustum]|uniref:Uncharacterized protein n=1 Tax=Smittium angustum TaxID=133377 RepID=A0A2U1JAH7_SMIAN|nr:hypothetical protein BB558_001830 [Smittium angustum]